MSGRRNKTQGDINKSRNEYMETLNLQAKINDENLQANKTYLLTGQLPPQSQMQDTRTNAEKLKDVDLLKQNIAKGLAPIAEPQFATQIVEAVMNSALNVDNTLLRFLAQRTPSIVEQLKKIITIGIKGDANDLQRIVEYIRNLYSETQGKFMTTKSYMNSISSSSYSSRVISANDLDPVINGIDDIIKNVYMMKHTGNVAGMAGIDTILDRIKRRLEELKMYLPKTEEIDRLVKDSQMMDTYKGDISSLYKHLENLPKYSEVMALVNKIKEYISSDSLTTARSGINNLERLFSGILNPTVLTELQNFRNHVKIPIQQEINFQNEMESIQTMEKLEDERRRLHSKSKAQKVWIINPEEDAVWVRNARALNGIPGSAMATDASEREGSIPSHVGDVSSVGSELTDDVSALGNNNIPPPRQARNNNLPQQRQAGTSFVNRGNDAKILRLNNFKDKYQRGGLNERDFEVITDIITSLEADMGLNFTRDLDIFNMDVDEIFELIDLVSAYYYRHVSDENDDENDDESSMFSQSTNDIISFNNLPSSSSSSSRSMPPPPPSSSSSSSSSLPQIRGNTRDIIDNISNYIDDNNLTRPQATNFIRNTINSMPTNDKDRFIQKFSTMVGTSGLMDINTIIRDLTEYIYRGINIDEMINHDIFGSGMRKRVGRPRGGSVKPPPPPKVPNYVGFGVNEINRKNLEKGIFTMRRNTKTNYMDMPSKHISKNLQSIIKTMIGGGVPKYEELGKLDNEEKEYLYKIVSRSNMEDKLSVPAPSKDQQEKDIHNFEVMKGQLMSGNDSKELVKTFKLLTRKLARQGLLPKADVEDIMDTLLSLGY